MYRLMNEINDRIVDMLTDPRDLYHLAYSAPNEAATGTDTTWEGHVAQVKQKQRELQKTIIKALEQGCPIPGGAWEMAGRRIPKQPYQRRRGRLCNDWKVRRSNYVAEHRLVFALLAHSRNPNGRSNEALFPTRLP
jgi:hypothetical protein